MSWGTKILTSSSYWTPVSQQRHRFMALESFSGASPWPTTLCCSGGGCLCVSLSVPEANGLVASAFANTPLCSAGTHCPLIISLIKLKLNRLCILCCWRRARVLESFSGFFPAKPAGLLKDDFLFLWTWPCLSVPVSQCHAVPQYRVWRWFLCPPQWAPQRDLVGCVVTRAGLLCCCCCCCTNTTPTAPRLPLAAACGGEHSAKV